LAIGSWQLAKKHNRVPCVFRRLPITDYRLPVFPSPVAFVISFTILLSFQIFFLPSVCNSFLWGTELRRQSFDEALNCFVGRGAFVTDGAGVWEVKEEYGKV